VTWRLALVVSVGLAWLGPASAAHAQSEAPQVESSVAPIASIDEDEPRADRDDAGLDPADVAERDAIQGNREIMWGLFGAGGTLLTAGGFGIFGYAFPGNGLVTIATCGSAALIGLVMLVAAIALDTDVHRRTDALRARHPHLVGGPGDVGLALALRF